ncbi:hypothetical protein OBBRIDRAFT_135330 [Obba rivulosa]|uniref:F-box domain-containing protein n=1 Tax=Obba rivulosa TaxID=1052685 RepID=A0A8E2AW25_9APHY|nr:hypothetical protein OBBRIDRAFT_135330 [Obba rivulosa]
MLSSVLCMGRRPPQTMSTLELARLLHSQLNKTRKLNESLRVEELRSLEQVLSEALILSRAALNACTRINQLPPEILGIIFGHVRRHVPIESNDSYGTRGGRPRWITPGLFYKTTDLLPISHVCARWRAVALSFPSLWTSIHDTHFPKLRALFLERAKQAPLQVTMYGLCGNPRSDAVETILQEGTRPVRAVRIVNCGSATSDACLQFPAAHLETLELWAPVSNLPANLWSFSPTLFRGETPRLRTLTMDSVGWFPANQLPSLTCLRLADSRLLSEYSVTSLLAFLSRCPGLQDLFISLAHMNTPGLHRNARVAALPHLRRLSIRLSNYLAVQEFLAHLDIPDDLALRIHLFPMQMIPRLDTVVHMGILSGCTRLCIDLSHKSLAVTVAGTTRGVRVESAALEDPADACQSWIRATRNQWEKCDVRIDELWIRALDGGAGDFIMLDDILGVLPHLTAVHLCGSWSPMDVQTVLGKTRSRGEAPPFRCSNLEALSLWQEQELTIDTLEDVSDIVSRSGHPVGKVIIGRGVVPSAAEMSRRGPSLVGALKVEADQWRCPSMQVPPACRVGDRYWPSW